MACKSDTTQQLLAALRHGEHEALDPLFARVYDELRARAHGQLGPRRSSQTLNTTALVHEAYLKLVDQTQASWQDRAHFLAVAAKAMRQITIDEVRRQQAQKRGGSARRVELSEAQTALGVAPLEVDLLDLNEALSRLSLLDDRLGQVAELRIFGGLSVEEVAEVLGVVARTVKRDLRKVRIFLHRELQA